MWRHGTHVLNDFSKHCSKHIKEESVTELMDDYTPHSPPPLTDDSRGFMHSQPLHGFQLELSGTCTQSPIETKVGQYISMHREQSSI